MRSLDTQPHLVAEQWRSRRKRAPWHSVILAGFLAAPVGASAQMIEIEESQLADRGEECQRLGRLIIELEQPVRVVTPEEVTVAINEDRAEECTSLYERIAADTSQGAGSAQQLSETEQEQERERLTDQVEVQEEATIEGEAVVAVPEPNVDVQVEPPRVQVTQQPPQIDVTQEPAQIELRQDRPRIAVEIPEIIVRVEIPAPTLYVLQQDPQVSVIQQDPQVEVSQPEPRVTVTQRDPKLDIDLDLAAGEEVPEDGQEERVESSDVGSDGALREQRRVTVSGEPQIEIAEGEGQAQVNYNSGDPNFTYETVEPEISVAMAEQPTVELSRSGEAQIIVETPQERQQRQQEQQQAQSGSQQQSQGNAEQAQAGAGGTAMTVGELMNMEVVDARDEELGSPEAFLQLDGETFLVLESGGFLGIGQDQVPVPISRVTLQGDRLVLQDMTEDEIEDADGFDYDSSQQLPADQEVRIGG